MDCVDKFMEEKHIQSYYKNTSFGSGASCVTDCGALEEYSGKLRWWLLWLLTISQAPTMSLLETGLRASWDCSVTQYICCFASSLHGNGFECLWQWFWVFMPRTTQRCAKGLERTPGCTLPKSRSEGWGKGRGLTTAKPLELCSSWHGRYPFWPLLLCCGR